MIAPTNSQYKGPVSTEVPADTAVVTAVMVGKTDSVVDTPATCKEVHKKHPSKMTITREKGKVLVPNGHSSTYLLLWQLLRYSNRRK